ncbi:hypothetical protein RND71_023494 [Anisodus tanguticus]|uniref:XS domain-containing protein n=1 Tax=Anisodus tanguticus TaxID=243964 RepID=A0AAE1RSP9_9SOLA|nr:hypothetical protein RND71_023494 [Anisodus tanguticus]
MLIFHLYSYPLQWLLDDEKIRYENGIRAYKEARASHSGSDPNRGSPYSTSFVHEASTSVVKDRKLIGTSRWVLKELRDYFSSYDVKTVKHSNGHRGISAMVFEATVMGTWRLCFSVSIFLKKGRDRDAWERNPVRFNLEGIRKLYGYRAQKRDLDNFNQHSHVRNAAMHMSEDNQQLVWFKNQAAKYQKKTKALEETLSLVNMAFQYFGPGARNKKRILQYIFANSFLTIT